MEASSLTVEYLTPDEIRGMSVVQVSEAVAFGHLSSTPIPNGLYDLRMGPINKSDMCKTCGLAGECPGHMGHVELAAELYNPFMLKKLMLFLRKMCTKCGHFRVHSDFTDRVCDLFKLLRCSQETTPFFLDLLDEVSRSALEKDFSGQAETHSMLLQDVSSSTFTFEEKTLTKAEVEQLVKKLKVACGEAQRRANHEASAAASAAKPSVIPVAGETAAIETLTALYLAAIPASKCANCNSQSPLFRLDGYSKVFVKPRGASAVEEKYLFPRDVRVHIDLLFRKEKRALAQLLPGTAALSSSASTNKAGIFFLSTVAVPPNRFRPLRIMGGAGAGGTAAYMPQATLALKAVLDADALVRRLLEEELLNPSSPQPQATQPQPHPEATAAQATAAQPQPQAQGGLPGGKSVGAAMVRLQDALNAFMDSSKNPKAANPDSIKWGIRQLLERKQGLFRMKMMGKRVNYAARSVISPDAMLATNQIGIPLFIAKTLTMPEPANALNGEYLRGLVENGADKYPGAMAVEDAETGRTVSLVGRSAQQREALAATLLVGGKKIVHRHLRTSDPLLINRQPTLHKPGIMALLVRVLNKEKTLRMHYANCNTFNADFDGDEINAHAPQSFQARSEALHVALCDRQYLGPTAAQPLRGLIQDHVVAGAMLTRRDSFLTKDQFMELLYAGLRATIDDATVTATASGTGSGRGGNSACVIERVKLPSPALLKPQRLFTGKQLVSAFMAALVQAGRLPGSGLFFTGKARTPGDLWNSRLDGNKEEEVVVVRDSELLQGVLDKNAFGNAHGGLTHTFYELLGPKKTGLLLTGFARLFTLYLQWRGFTCAMGDLLVKPQEEALRRKLLQEATTSGWAKMRNWVAEELAGTAATTGGSGTATTTGGSGSGSESLLAELQWGVKEVFVRKGGVAALGSLEAVMLGNSSEYWGKCIEALVPRGLECAFPKNCFSAMVNTGAKGSKVNMSQICALLGQQELEGRRVPTLRTLKSLPCFAAFDLASRAGGFVADRFLTGVRPQEFFFHCMAGREGLIDTAVKTARSGYLQRCLVKGLEALVVRYDHTVRDSGDGAIVQFLYGEDGQDVTRASYLHKLDVLAANRHLLPAAEAPEAAAAAGAKAEAELEAFQRWRRKPHSRRRRDEAVQAVETSLRLSAAEKRQIVRALETSDETTPLAALFAPFRFRGATSEQYERGCAAVAAAAAAAAGEGEELETALRERFVRGMASAGEAVGVLAAQGMGEPSTQMTLNTFHLAGHGGANVTLGIPRLREIVQTASRSIATPSMTVECRGGCVAEQLGAAKQIAARLERVALKDLVKTVHVAEKVVHAGGANAQASGGSGRRNLRQYELVVEFVEELETLHEAFPGLSRAKVAQFMETEFRAKLEQAVKKLIRLSNATAGASVVAKASSRDAGRRTRGDGAGDGEAGAEAGAEAEAAGESEEQQQQRHGEGEEEAGDGDSSSDGSGAYSEAEAEAEAEPEAEGEEEEASGDETEGRKRRRVEGEVEGEEGEAGDSAGVVVSAADDQIFGQPGRLVGSRYVVRSAGIPLSHRLSRKILILEVVAELCSSLTLQQAQGISRVLVDEKGAVTTEGVNLDLFWQMEEVEHDKLNTNDIGLLLDRYGVEACRGAIVKEVSRVFGHYGISVDKRHLYLIADYMTHQGNYRPFNRSGIASHSSPFLKMTFETSVNFLAQAAEQRLTDNLQTASGALVVGKLASVGTGVFDLIHDKQAAKTNANTNKTKNKTKTAGLLSGLKMDEDEDWTMADDVLISTH